MKPVDPKSAFRGVDRAGAERPIEMAALTGGTNSGGGSAPGQAGHETGRVELIRGVSTQTDQPRRCRITRDDVPAVTACGAKLRGVHGSGATVDTQRRNSGHGVGSQPLDGCLIGMRRQPRDPGNRVSVCGMSPTQTVLWYVILRSWPTSVHPPHDVSTYRPATTRIGWHSCGAAVAMLAAVTLPDCICPHRQVRVGVDFNRPPWTRSSRAALAQYPGAEISHVVHAQTVHRQPRFGRRANMSEDGAIATPARSAWASSTRASSDRQTRWPTG